MSYDEDAIIETVVGRIAAQSGAEPLELEPLASVIDPALVVGFVTADAVSSESELRFHYDEYEVRIAGDGAVTVEDSH